MSKFTQADYDALQQAEIDLLIGKRIAKVTVDGETIEYGLAKINDLRAYKQMVASDLDDGSQITRFCPFCRQGPLAWKLAISI